MEQSVLRIQIYRQKRTADHGVTEASDAQSWMRSKGLREWLDHVRRHRLRHAGASAPDTDLSKETERASLVRELELFLEYASALAWTCRSLYTTRIGLKSTRTNETRDLDLGSPGLVMPSIPSPNFESITTGTTLTLNHLHYSFWLR